MQTLDVEPGGNGGALEMVLCLTAGMLALEKLVGASQCSAVRVQLDNLNGAALLLRGRVYVFPFENLTVLDLLDGATCRAKPLDLV